MDGDHRTFSRVSTRLTALARTLESAGSPSLFQGYPAPPIISVGKMGGAVPQALIDFLTAIDAKLDMLLSLESKKQLREDFPIVLEVTEISAAGVTSHSEDHFEQDDYLELVIHLSNMPFLMAGAVARVVRSSQEGGRQVYAAEFTDIRDTDTEAIVQYVFQEQRQQLRKKWE
jgi:hypothetical protein